MFRLYNVSIIYFFNIKQVYVIISINLLIVLIIVIFFTRFFIFIFWVLIYTVLFFINFFNLFNNILLVNKVFIRLNEISFTLLINYSQVIHSKILNLLQKIVTFLIIVAYLLILLDYFFQFMRILSHYIVVKGTSFYNINIILYSLIFLKDKFVKLR